MADSKDLDRAYMDMARTWGGLSRAKRARVGCLVVKGDMIISDGFNGMPSGFPNECEDVSGATRPEVLHAEANALTKLARSASSGSGATLYSTVLPCLQCAKLIIQVKISRVVYAEMYRDDSAIGLFARAGIACDLEEPPND
jgi:dCMP deaminase